MSNGNKRQQNNYFQREIQRNGRNFINHKNAMDLQRDAIYMFRDLVKGKINIPDYMEYFVDPQFLEACITVSDTRGRFHAISRDGVDIIVRSKGANADYMELAALDFHQKAAAAYEMLNVHFRALKANPENVEILYPLAGQLRSYRDYI